nr:hypothetical protein [Lachnospiraceae bacterium]
EKTFFKKTKFEFDIAPVQITEENIYIKKNPKVKNGKIKVSGLKFDNGTKKIGMKLSKDGTKGDFTATLSDNSIVIEGINNYTGGAVLEADIQESKTKNEDRETASVMGAQPVPE